MSNVSKRKKEGLKTKIKTMGDHKEFLKRISKSLYYGTLPELPCLSLPVTEISCAAWSVSQRGRSLRRLHADAAADIARQACVSPCALVLAILYLERLKRCNPDYLAAAAPADLFLVSLMVSNKFLQDDGEEDEVVCAEWAASGGLRAAALRRLEIDFLRAIDWNVFVSDESFEAGLAWLEREVALKQARLHGFFTYSDLSAAGGGAALRAALRACLAAALAYLALLAALAAALLLAHVALTRPAPAPDASAPAPATPLRPVSNDTLDIPEALAHANLRRLECCERWTKYRGRAEEKKSWYDGAVEFEWEWVEPWWSRTSVLNWLYQSSLISPARRWLDELAEYAERARAGPAPPPRRARSPPAPAAPPAAPAAPWLQLGKLGALVASVSDR